MLTITGSKDVDWANMPLNDLLYGCAMDCDFTKRLYPKIKEELLITNVYKTYDLILSKVITCMAEVEHRGVKIDTEYLKVLDVELKKTIKDLEDKMRSLIPKAIDSTNISFTSKNDIIGILHTPDGFNLPVLLWNPKSKLPSIKSEIIEALQLKIAGIQKHKTAEEFIDTYVTYKKYKKYHTDYVIGVLKSIEYNGHKRAYSKYNFSSVKTGRLSNSSYNTKVKEGNKVKIKKKGIPFHTLPRNDETNKINIRKLIIPDSGYAIVVADYATAEVRMLAHCAEEKELIKAFNNKEDLHTYTACLIFEKEKADITKFERQIAKSVTFLILYGGGPRKLASQVKISLTQAKWIFEKYHKAYPGINKWTKHVRTECDKTTEAHSLFGRTRHLLNVRSPSHAIKERAYRQGVNFIIQSSASDLMLHAIYRLEHMIEHFPIINALGIQVFATVHDSLEVQCPIDNVHKVAKVVKYCMADTKWIEALYGFRFKVPFEVDVEVGKAFGDVIPVIFDDKGNVTNKKALIAYATR